MLWVQSFVHAIPLFVLSHLYNRSDCWPTQVATLGQVIFVYSTSIGSQIALLSLFFQLQDQVKFTTYIQVTFPSKSQYLLGFHKQRKG